MHLLIARSAPLARQVRLLVLHGPLCATCTWATPVTRPYRRRCAGAFAEIGSDSLCGSGCHCVVHCTDAGARLAASAAAAPAACAVSMVGRCWNVETASQCLTVMLTDCMFQPRAAPCRRATEPLQDVASESEDHILETLKKVCRAFAGGMRSMFRTWRQRARTASWRP